MGVYTGQKLCGSTFYAHQKRLVILLAAFKVAAMMMLNSVKPEISPKSDHHHIEQLSTTRWDIHKLDPATPRCSTLSSVYNSHNS